jgi:biopolymer transport protein ExbB
MTLPLLLAQTTPPTVKLDNLYDFIVAGGPIMWPLGLCSVIALAFTVERWIRLNRGAIGSRRFGETVVESFKTGGAKAALDACAAKRHALARILRAGLERVDHGPAAIDKAVEDIGSQEVRRMSSSLRPLAVVVMIAPLLGLLGTVWGMVEAFSNIALKEGMGKPELLASGISQALITTVAGLVIAIPTQAIYFWFKGKIDRFVSDVEDLHGELEAAARAKTQPLTMAAAS